MLRYISYRLTLCRLKRIERQKWKKYEDEKSRYDLNDAYAEAEFESMWGGELQELEMWILLTQTEYLESECQVLVLPFPRKEEGENFSIFNFDDERGDRYILTTAGIHLVRGMIREEKKARSERFRIWASLLMGLMGTLIGLISALKK